MEFVQFHPTGMVWPPSVKASSSPRRSAATAVCSRTPTASASCSRTSRRCSKASTRRRREEADNVYDDPDNNRRTPDLLPRDRGGARHQLRGQGRSLHTPTAASISTSRRACPTRRSCGGCRRCTTSSRNSPTSTSPRTMEVGPTCHYVMGASRSIPTPDPPRWQGVRGSECSGGMHGSNRLGGTRCPICWCSGAGPDSARRLRPVLGGGARRWRRPTSRRLHGLHCCRSIRRCRGGGEPHTLHTQRLQQTMNDLVGIIRTEAEIERAIASRRRQVPPARVTVEGHRQFNPDGISHWICGTWFSSASAWHARR